MCLITLLNLRPRKRAILDIGFPKSDIAQDSVSELIRRYLHLTGTVMPELASTERQAWPVRNDHCFRRIVLDSVCGGVWYDHLSRPAYRHLNLEQAQRAVQLCEDIIAGTADLIDLNRKSLSYRGKLGPLQASSRQFTRRKI